MSRKVTKIDMWAKVCLYPTERGGKKLPISEIDPHSCLIEIKGDLYSAFILMEKLGKRLYPGECEIVPITFLDQITPKSKLQTHDHFNIVEGRIVGEGEVVEIL